MRKILLTVGSLLLLAGCSAGAEGSQDAATQKEKEVATEQQVPSKEKKDTGEQKQGQTAEKGKMTLEAAYFNDIVEVNGRKVIQNPTNMLVLVNKEFGLPDGYAPEDLVRPNVPFSFGDQDIEKSYMRKEAAQALEAMFADAANNGIQLHAVSGYRSYQRQTEVFNAEVANSGQEQAVQVVAVPGNSEHQTGLAMDISSASANFALSEQFGQTPEGKWLVDHAHRFGFILRYPKGKEGITGYQYESWHFRYVGVKAATEMYQHQLTLEEYFNAVEKM